MFRVVAILSLPCLLILGPRAFAEETPSRPIWRDAPVSATETELDRLSQAFAQIATNARPAIVQIRVIKSAEEPPSTGSTTSQSRGSGFIVDPEGFIVTAQHVIDKAHEVEVRLSDGQRLAARIVAADAQIDVAILKITPDEPLPALFFADSDRNRIGDLAVVFGYPFGRESSMHLGIISRTGRSFPDSSGYELIQTDAGAYAGGSGGPLLNSKGHVIGVITMASERGNMGFATPINVVKRILPRMMKGERLVWGWLGVQTTEVTLEHAKRLGLSPIKGVLVNAVLPDQPAERSGLLRQDIILAVNDAQVISPRDVSRMIGGMEAGHVARLTIWRNGETLRLDVPLGEKPQSPRARES